MSYRFHLSYECQILLALLSRRQVRWEHSTVHDTYLLISNSESCSGRCPIQTSHLRFTIMLLRNFSFIELLPLASSPAFTLRLIFSCACICRDVANSVVNDADQRCTSRYRSAEMSRQQCSSSATGLIKFQTIHFARVSKRQNVACLSCVSVRHVSSANTIVCVSCVVACIISRYVVPGQRLLLAPPYGGICDIVRHGRSD